jgi:hypothetical protein
LLRFFRGKLRRPSGEVGANGFIFDLPTGKTSPCVVNQSGSFFVRFRMFCYSTGRFILFVFLRYQAPKIAL